MNDDREAVRYGHTIRGQDDNAAVTIAIAGYSNPISRQALQFGESRTLLSFEPSIDSQDRDPTPSTSDFTGTYVESEGIDAGTNRRDVRDQV